MAQLFISQYQKNENLLNQPMIKNNNAINLEDSEKIRLKELLAEQSEKIENSQVEVANLLTELQEEIESRKKTEQALHESEARFRNFFEKAADAIFIAEADSGIIIDANQAACRLVKKSYESILGKHFSMIHPLEDQESSQESFNTHKQELIKNFSTRPIENRILCSDNSIIPVEVIASEVDLKGKRCLIGTFRDISWKKQAEERYKSIFENAVEGLYQSTPEGQFLTANPAMARILGYDSPESLLNERTNINIQGYADPHGRDDFMQKMEKFGSVTGYEYQAARREGSSVWVSENARLMTDANGKKYYEGSLVDITDRKLAEMNLIAAKEKAEKIQHELQQKNMELSERNSFIQTVLDNLPIGIALNTINDGAAKYMNRKFEEIYGWSSAEITSVPSFFECVYPAPDYRKELMDKVLADIQSGDPERMRWDDLAITHKDGSIHWINAVNIPLIEQNTMVSTVTDITDLHKSKTELIAAKEKAEESDRLKSAFLANMSHEIRTPLNSIIGFSELLHDPFYSDEQQAEFANYIKENGNYLLTIISDIMDFSKIESGQVCIHKKKFLVNNVVGKLYNEFVFKTKEKDIELEMALPDNDIQLIADEERLRQVLTNLLGNAIKFTSKGFVRLGAQIIGKNVQFHVSDTGIGIQAEYQEKIFERFWQVDSSKSRKYGGNGLGLAISKSLVELQGGKIWLESEPGKGSVFYFELPLEER
jgi:PAS domain S-box-containing protein